MLADLLRQLRAEGMGVLLVEHDMDFVMQLADRVVVMDFGQKIAEGPPDRCSPIPSFRKPIWAAWDDRTAAAAGGLRAGYGHVEVLHGVSLRCGEGQIVAIVGPNGAGKTTLMGAVMGLLPRRGGAVRYHGWTAGEDRALVAAGAVLVPEQRALFTDMSVEDNLLLGLLPAAPRGRARSQSPRCGGVRDLPPAGRTAPAVRRARCRAGSGRCWRLGGR